MLGTFFLKLIKPKNWLALIYFLANAFILYLFFGHFVSFSNLTTFQNGLIGVGVYILSVAAAMSPFGEWIGRTLQGKLVPVEQVRDGERLRALFEEVYCKALKQTPRIGKKVRLYVCFDGAANAFALGKNTICVHDGLLGLQNTEIQGILAHEFGHLANRDTLFAVALVAGNLLATTVFLILRIVFVFAATLIDGVLKIDFLGVMVNFLILIPMYIWNIIGVFMINAGCRADEYRADAYANKLCYANELAAALMQIENCRLHNRIGLFEILNSSHPATRKRIQKLQDAHNPQKT